MIKRVLWILKKHFLMRKKEIDANWSSLSFGKCHFEGKNYIGANVLLVDSSMGIFSYINSGSKVIMTKIGRYSCIGPECMIGGLGAHPINRISTHRMFYSKSKKIWSDYCLDENFEEKKFSIIGNDVWIGARVIILDGISVGDGAIIAAGSVVTKDVPPYSIVGGVPAKIIKKRFSDENSDNLLKSKWWNFDDKYIKEMVSKGEFSSAIE